MDRADDAGVLGLELVEELHRLENAEHLTRNDGVADVDERRRSRGRRAVEDADHRRLDARDRRRGDAVATLGDVSGLGVHVRRDGHRDRPDRVVCAAHGDAHAVVLDLDLPDAGLLHDLHELADPLPAFRVGVLGDQHGVARVPRPDDLQELLGVGAEHRDQDELLLARREAFRLLAYVLGRHGILDELRARREQRHRALDVRVDRLGRHAVAALHELAELVDDGAVPARLEHV